MHGDGDVGHREGIGPCPVRHRVDRGARRAAVVVEHALDRERARGHRYGGATRRERGHVGRHGAHAGRRIPSVVDLRVHEELPALMDLPSQVSRGLGDDRPRDVGRLPIRRGDELVDAVGGRGGERRERAPAQTEHQADADGHDEPPSTPRLHRETSVRPVCRRRAGRRFRPGRPSSDGRPARARHGVARCSRAPSLRG